MHQFRRRSSLAPSGLFVRDLEIAPDAIKMVAYSASKSSACPTCSHVSPSVYSRYQQVLSDLPSHGRAVQTRVMAHRFRCQQPELAGIVWTDIGVG